MKLNLNLVTKIILASSAISGCCFSLFASNLTWKLTEAPPNLWWRSVASSADGIKLVAASPSSGIYVSTNSGLTWDQTKTGQNWYCVASSADGTKVAAGNYAGGISVSTNSGVDWMATSAPITNWNCIALSADGVRLVAGLDNGLFGGIYTSTNAGSNWTQSDAPLRVWESVATSSDGSKSVAVELNGGVYTSTDSGFNWNLSSAPDTNSWLSVASSSDGTKLVAVANGANGAIYTSTNSGISWKKTSAPKTYWYCVASSSNGANLVAGIANYGGIYTSTNAGGTWTISSAPNNLRWQSIASSSDGSKVVAVTERDGVWIGQFKPEIIAQPETSLACPGNLASLTVGVSGSLPLVFQWRRNGTNLIDGGNMAGATSTNLLLSNVSSADEAGYDVVITNAVGSITSSVANLNLNIRPARAVPLVINGFVVGVSILDGGCGYSNPPAITFGGQGGSGAIGYAEINNSAVTDIIITSAGSNYQANAAVFIAPPFYPTLSIVQLLTNTPSATATPVVTNGFIVGATITAPGSGYTTNPSVSFSDVSGHGAAAYSQVSGGSVTNIVITSAGAGYSSNVVINIAPTPTIRVVIPSANSLLLGQNYQLQTANDLNGWMTFGMPFSATTSAWTPTNHWNVADTNQLFFRLKMLQ